MAALSRSAPAAALAFAALVTTPAAASPVDRWRPLIVEASQRFGIPQEWIVAVMRAESGGMTTLHGRPITSAAGAMGLMQLMPDTWAAMRDALRLGADPYDPRDNILAGTFYLRRMRDRFGYPGMFAAYNAGPARYATHLARGRALPGETIAYLANVSAGAKTASVPAATRPRQAIFFAVSSASSATSIGADSSRRDGLFVPLAAAPGRPD